ncbi:MAG: trypsin-like peptidase domain-containing protein [Hydrogenophaga sp.]|uniref:S1C family serine protease n=1 Tax=Hydrogenophaga sp. TaxID=1904254 RepID=UPI0025BF278D|nr:serine protease [Hydrogenophaga sp.]MBU7571724.1 trypsin-like peptidase domain-containing protein [Hydrogenophaga sp.]
MAAAAVSAPAWALEPDALFAKVAPSVWTVVATDAQARSPSHGNAVVIGPGRLITSCHVLARMTRLQVVKGNVSYGGRLEFPDPENDLCQIQVDNFQAPAVELAPGDTLRVGARVFAIGAPQGQEATLSDGLLSGLRRDEQGKLLFVQTTAPLVAGSSGGGLFDAEGRLIGITTLLRREAPNINLAVPAYRITELPQRGRELLERRAATRVTAAPVAAPSGGRQPTAQRRPGDWFEYVVTDSQTKLKSTVSLKVDRVDGGRIVFNGGGRVEDETGRVQDSSSAALLELDLVTPPGGWAPGGQVMSGFQPLKFSTSQGGDTTGFDVTAVASGPQAIRVGESEYNAVRIDIRGWTSRLPVHRVAVSNLRYQATVWYSPDLMRVVRFTLERLGSTDHKEVLELVRAGRG